MRDMSEIRARAPQHGMKWFFNDYAFGNIQHNTILCERASQRGKFTFLNIDRLANHLCKQFRVLLFSSF